MEILSIVYAFVVSTAYIALYLHTYMKFFERRDFYYLGIIFVLLSIYTQFTIVAYFDVNVGLAALLTFVTYPIGLSLIYRTNIFNILFLSFNIIVKIYIMFLFFGALFALLKGVAYDPNWIRQTDYFAFSQGNAYLISIGSLYLFDILLIKNKLIDFFLLKRNLLLLISIQLILILNMAWLSFTEITIESVWYNQMLLITSFSFEIIYFLLRLFTANSSYFSSFKVKTDLLSKQLTRQIEHYRNYEEQMIGFSKFKHDYDKIIKTITNLLSLKQYDAIQEILKDYNKGLELMLDTRKNYSNNIILDALLNDYARRFMRVQTKFDSSAYIKLGTMTELDLIKLFYNILENALEAVQKVDESIRIMEIKSEMVEDYIKISFVNTTDNKTILTDKTTKLDRQNHGFGKSIINDVLTLYNGFSNAFVTVKDDVSFYHLEIFLPNK